jgi:4-hydroxyphenylpyruvate dioxygenase
MRTSIATVCVPGTLTEKLEAISTAGFRHVEIFEADLIAHPGSPAEIRRLCGDLGLSIVTCQPFRDFEGMPKEKRARTFERAERKFDLLQELGTDLLFVCSSVAPDAMGGIDRLAGDFAELGERAARRGLRVGYEALSWGRHVHDWRDSWEIVRRAGRDNVGLVLDTFHILARGTDVSGIATVPKENIAFVQIADAPLLQMDYLSWARHWRCLPGQGDLDLGGFMDVLAASGYDGVLSLEIFNDRFRAGSARSIARDGRRSLLWLMDETSRRRGERLPDTVPMPPPQRVDDVAFVEFAVGATDRAVFEQTLRALGFAHVGQHRSKDVALFRQGAINLVLNSARSGFAFAWHATHGTCVCALALHVADAGATIARATSLLDTPHTGAVGPGERDIAAVRGLGGSLTYFVDGSNGDWAQVDFLATGETAAGSGLTRIDHVSQTMPHEEMLTWLLFWCALFEAGKSGSQAVLDPGGVVQSQVIESGVADGAGLRLVLNGSQSHRTLSARFIADTFGSGVQHIALATDDIVATVRHLNANGVSMLSIPQNYYDDLEARSDLTAPEIMRLQSLGILWDSDAGGTFRHAYTQMLEGGFFFEIVERKGYRGYGAANAGVRLAAQSRVARPLTVPAR